MTEKDTEAPASGATKAQPAGWERTLLERLAFASLNEQRKARRWGIFFKLFFTTYLLLLLFMALSENWSGKALTTRHTALVEMEGEISSSSLASADNVISGLRAAFESSVQAGSRALAEHFHAIRHHAQ